MIKPDSHARAIIRRKLSTDADAIWTCRECQIAVFYPFLLN